MQGRYERPPSMFSYVDAEARIRKDDPVRKIRQVLDDALAGIAPEFEGLYSNCGRPSIPPEHLIRAAMVQILFSIRSERQLMYQMDLNMLFRWFVGIGMDDPIWDPSTFAKNRDRLLTTDMVRKVMEGILEHPEVAPLLSSEHFSVDGTLIKAWASMKSFQPKEGAVPEARKPGKSRNAEVDFKGRRRSNETHSSTTDPDARLARKSHGEGAILGYRGHVVVENRNGLVVETELTLATGYAERVAAAEMPSRLSNGSGRRRTVGADKGCNSAPCVAALRDIGFTPHVAQKAKGSAIDGRTTRHEGCAVSQRKRKLVEEPFGWAKTVGGMAQTSYLGRDRVEANFILTMAANNLARLPRLLAA